MRGWCDEDGCRGGERQISGLRSIGFPSKVDGLKEIAVAPGPLALFAFFEDGLGDAAEDFLNHDAGLDDFLGKSGGVEAVGSLRVVESDHAVFGGVGDEGAVAFGAEGGESLVAVAFLGHEVGDIATAVEEDEVEAGFGGLHDAENVLEAGAGFFEFVFEVGL